MECVGAGFRVAKDLDFLAVGCPMSSNFLYLAKLMARLCKRSFLL